MELCLNIIYIGMYSTYVYLVGNAMHISRYIMKVWYLLLYIH